MSRILIKRVKRLLSLLAAIDRLDQRTAWVITLQIGIPFFFFAAYLGSLYISDYALFRLIVNLPTSIIFSVLALIHKPFSNRSDITLDRNNNSCHFYAGGFDAQEVNLPLNKLKQTIVEVRQVTKERSTSSYGTGKKKLVQVTEYRLVFWFENSNIFWHDWIETALYNVHRLTTINKQINSFLADNRQQKLKIRPLIRGFYSIFLIVAIAFASLSLRDMIILFS